MTTEELKPKIIDINVEATALVDGDDVSAVEDEEFRLYAEKNAEENTIVAKLVTFDAIIHGYYKLSSKSLDKWLAAYNKRKG